MLPIHVETADIPSYAANKVMIMITTTGEVAEVVHLLEASAEVVSEAEAVSVEAALAEAALAEAALAEEWAVAAAPVLVSKENK